MKSAFNSEQLNQAFVWNLNDLGPQTTLQRRAEGQVLPYPYGRSFEGRAGTLPSVALSVTNKNGMVVFSGDSEVEWERVYRRLQKKLCK